jgi:hypothetical protein
MTLAATDANTYSPGWTGYLDIAAERFDHVSNYKADKTGRLSIEYLIYFNEVDTALQPLWLGLKIDSPILYSGGLGLDTLRQTKRGEAQMAMR